MWLLVTRDLARVVAVIVQYVIVVYEAVVVLEEAVCGLLVIVVHVESGNELVAGAR
jgi:hypothetical protein